MELALMITGTYMLKKINKLDYNFTRLYYGKDFCSNNTISIKEIEILINYCTKYNKDLTIVTPIIKYLNIDSYCEIFDYMVSNSYRCEVVVNDWGLLYFLKDRYKNYFTISLGRLLNRIKKSPQIVNILPKLNKQSKESLMTSSANYISTIELLNEYGISSIQYENIFQENYIDNNVNIERHILYPYVYVTSSMGCISTNLYNEEESDNSKLCSKICEQGKLTIYNPDVGCTSILLGNSKFYINKNIPDNINTFDRFIYMYI